MICTRLWAQLGNQCFMISAAIAHAKKMNTTWGVPRKSLDPRIWPTYFNLPESRVTLNFYKEKSHNYAPIPEQNDLTIEGYFQSEKYFEGAKEEVANALGFDFGRDQFVAIHVRRGDYLLYPDRFPVLPISYYSEAMYYLLKEHGNDMFVIFSDDINWCRNAFKNICPAVNISFSNIKDPVADMKSIFDADKFIISNSTFSLFPALLRQDNPIVIAPAEHRWYGAGAGLQTDTLMPERFIKL